MKKFTKISNKLIRKILLVCICLIILLICGVATLAFIIGWNNNSSNQLGINQNTTITIAPTSISVISNLISNYTTFFTNPTSTTSIQSFSQNSNQLTTDNSFQNTTISSFIASLNTNAHATIIKIENSTFLYNSTEILNTTEFISYI